MQKNVSVMWFSFCGFKLLILFGSRLKGLPINQWQEEFSSLFKVLLKRCYYGGKLKTTVCVIEEMMMMMMIMTLGIHLTAAVVKAVILANDTAE